MAGLASAFTSLPAPGKGPEDGLPGVRAFTLEVVSLLTDFAGSAGGPATTGADTAAGAGTGVNAAGGATAGTPWSGVRAG